MSDIGKSLDGRGSSMSQVGQGQPVRSLPETVPKLYPGFGKGYINYLSAQTIPDDASPYLIDFEATDDGRLVRMPGIEQVEDLSPHEPREIFLHASLDEQSELVMMDPPFLGVKRDGDTIWTSVDLPPGGPWVATNYAGTFLFTNMVDGVYARDPGDAVPRLTQAQPGRSLAVWAGRLWSGFALIGGNYEPLGIWWSGTASFDDNSIEGGSSFELMLNDLLNGDEIVALRPLGRDLMAILLRNSVWVAQRTGDLFRPGDFQPRSSGDGCISEKTARVTSRGVMYLSRTGVRVFDGSQDQPASVGINADLLPIDMGQIDKYSASYDPTRRRYTLYTPDATWEYDDQFDRWFRRSAPLTTGVIFATQPSPIYLGSIEGDPTLAGIGDVPLAALEGVEGYQEPYYISGPLLGKLAGRDLETAFGTPVTPEWHSKADDGATVDQLVTYKKAIVEYDGTATVEFIYPSSRGKMITYGQRELDGERNQFFFTVTGKGMQMGLRVLSGDITLRRIQLVGTLRGSRIGG